MSDVRPRALAPALLRAMIPSAPLLSPAIRWAALLSAAFLSAAFSAAPLAAQQFTASYADPGAAQLHRAAMEARERADDSVLRYTAKIRQRIAVALRAPLKDRTLYRMESAHRVFWSRDGDMLVQVLASREQTPAGVGANSDRGLFEESFDPMDDRLLFGFAADADADDEGSFVFEHPLYPEHAGSYRFASGDTLTLSLPDGRSVQAIELQVVPQRADVHRVAGSLWIEPRSGALVRAVWRLADAFDAVRDIPELREEEEQGTFRWVPGLFKPWTAELHVLAVEYSLWDFDVWLPRSMRIEGTAAAGIVKVPLTVDVAYEIEAVTTERSLAEDDGRGPVRTLRFRTRAEAFEWLEQQAFAGTVPFTLDPWVSRSDGRQVRFLVPEDTSFLAISPELPPPVWEDAPGFASREEIEGYYEGLAQLPQTQLAAVPWTWRWGPQRPDLVRYNRVEALSIGARAQVRPSTPWGPVSVTGTARLGIGDLHPNASLELTRETLRRRLSLRGYHELESIDERARHLGIGNSLLAATIGRDDGDYYRRSGAMLEWTPPVSRRRSFRVRSWAEYHRSVEAETDFSLFDWKEAFRPNLVAAEGWEYGGSLELTPWWGSDPNLAQGGLDVLAQAATGDAEWARASLAGTLVLPLGERFRVAFEAGAGTSWGSPTPQRLWYVGGPLTLRGYGPRTAGGTSFGRARVELARTFSFGRLSLFSDAAWAGDEDDIDLDDAFRSLGVGFSILDGLIRVDGAWGLDEPRDFRLDAYLDQIL